MNFYLETITPQALTDVGQYIPLAGVLIPQGLLTQSEANVKEVLDGLCDVLPAQSRIYAPLMPSNFRRMLIEARTVTQIYPQLVPMFCADPQSYMAVKACYTARIPAAVSDILYLEQAWIAESNHADKIIIDFRACSEVSDPVELLRSLSDLYDRILVTSLSDPGQVRLCMMLGIEHIAISEEMAHLLLENPASRSLAASKREAWIMAYTRDTLLDPADDSSSKQAA